MPGVFRVYGLDTFYFCILSELIRQYSQPVEETRELDSLTVLGHKLNDFLAESALALGKTVMLCVSALLMGILPGASLTFYFYI